MVAGLEGTEAPVELLARRRLAEAFRAADAVCTKCHIGYYGSSTSKCTRCEKMENCEYGLGHHDGVSCDSANGAHVPETCGICKQGFFAPYCTGCTDVEGCVESSQTCSTA